MKTFYAVRRKSDGALLPLPRGRCSGFSHLEPSLVDPPRLFPSKASAQNCLSMWLRGMWCLHTQGYGGEWESEFRVNPAGRVKGDYDVVKVSVRIR